MPMGVILIISMSFASVSCINNNAMLMVVYIYIEELAYGMEGRRGF